MTAAARRKGRSSLEPSVSTQAKAFYDSRRTASDFQLAALSLSMALIESSSKNPGDKLLDMSFTWYETKSISEKGEVGSRNLFIELGSLRSKSNTIYR